MILSIVIAIYKRITFREILNLSIFYLIFYTITVLSLAYTRNINYGIKNLETMISLIFMPFLLVVLKKTMTREKINNLIDIYIAGLLIYFVFSLVVLFIRWDIKDITSYIKTDTLTGTSSYLHLSPILQKSYISMYLVWGIALLIDRLFNSKYHRPLAFSIVPLVIFFLFTFALGSRAAMLTLAVVLIFYIFKYLKRYSFWISIPVTLAVIVLLITGLFRFTRIGETISALKKDSKSDKRIPQWISAFEVVRNAPVFGYGVGDGLDEIVRQHKENG
jgi:O-antigen ligase